jgi:hypothetical protein
MIAENVDAQLHLSTLQAAALQPDFSHPKYTPTPMPREFDLAQAADLAAYADQSEQSEPLPAKLVRGVRSNLMLQILRYAAVNEVEPVATAVEERGRQFTEAGTTFQGEPTGLPAPERYHKIAQVSLHISMLLRQNQGKNSRAAQGVGTRPAVPKGWEARPR